MCRAAMTSQLSAVSNNLPEHDPISFKTSCPSNTNNERISLLTKSKSYGGTIGRLAAERAGQRRREGELSRRGCHSALTRILAPDFWIPDSTFSVLRQIKVNKAI